MVLIYCFAVMFSFHDYVVNHGMYFIGISRIWALLWGTWKAWETLWYCCQYSRRWASYRTRDNRWCRYGIAGGYLRNTILSWCFWTSLQSNKIVLSSSSWGQSVLLKVGYCVFHLTLYSLSPCSLISLIDVVLCTSNLACSELLMQCSAQLLLHWSLKMHLTRIEWSVLWIIRAMQSTFQEGWYHPTSEPPIFVLTFPSTIFSRAFFSNFGHFRSGKVNPKYPYLLHLGISVPHQPCVYYYLCLLHGLLRLNL